MASEGETRYDAILGELLQALESGELPDRDELLARHPGAERTVDRVLAAVRRYEALRQAESTPPRGAALRAGERLGDFEIEGRLGAGGMGVVYRARQRSLAGRPVAVKVFAAPGADARSKARFERESLAASSLHHPHLAEVYGFGSEEDLLFYAMRLVAGPSLREVLVRLAGAPERSAEPALQRRIVTRVAEVAAALSVVHEHGLVHRDVKPSNVLLDLGGAGDDELVPDAPAVLVDFGLARPVRAPLDQTLTLGAATPAYASPEQALGEEIGPASDVFSLGATLHDLLAARLSDQRLPASAGLEPLRTLVPGIDADLEAVVLEATHPDRRSRYPDGARLHADLRAWLEGRPVSARHAGLLERGRRALRTHPERLLRGLLLATAALVALFLLAWLGTQALAAHRASLALGRGDVERAAREIEGLSPALLPALAWDGDVRRFARQLARGDPTDPVVAVSASLRDGDATLAVQAAATELERDGFERERWCGRWLLSLVESAQADPHGPSLRLIALRGLARLFLERPDQERAEQRARAPFRAALLGLWKSESLSPEEELHALAALSGCARLADVPEIARWSAALPCLSEPQRSGLRCVERTVRRATRLGEIDAGTIRAAWSAALPALREHARVKGAVPSTGFSGRYAYGTLLEALGCAAARLGIVLDPADVYPDQLRESPDVPMAKNEGDFLNLLAALRDPRLEPWLAAAPRPGVTAKDLGHLCGLYGSPSVSAASGLRLLLLDVLFGGDRCCAFVVDLALASPLRDGRDVTFWLDADSYLTASPARDFRRLRGEGSPRAEPMGSWEFRARPPRYEGMARGARVRAAGLREDSLRFSAFGTSEVLLDVTTLGRPRAWILRLFHHKSLRPYLPFQGEAVLALAVDGQPLGTVLVPSIEGTTSAFPIIPDLLLPGEHTISVLLDARSTTTYRLLGVSLEPVADPLPFADRLGTLVDPR